MHSLTIKLASAIAKLTPARLLPTGTRQEVNCTTGVQLTIALNISERREILERNIDHHMNRFLDKYSIFRRGRASLRKLRQTLFMALFHKRIGEIALAHAAIEQDLKNELLYQWDFPENIAAGDFKGKKISDLFGSSIRKFFLQCANDCIIPERFSQRYTALLEKFWAASSVRNDVLKAAYVFYPEKGTISKMNMALFHRHPTNIASLEEQMREITKPVELKQLAALRDEFYSIRVELRKLNHEVFIDKLTIFGTLFSGIGSTIPAYANKNPYIFLQRKETMGNSLNSR